MIKTISPLTTTYTDFSVLVTLFLLEIPVLVITLQSRAYHSARAGS
jgi:hypothetical protein